MSTANNENNPVEVIQGEVTAIVPVPPEAMPQPKPKFRRTAKGGKLITGNPEWRKGHLSEGQRRGLEKAHATIRARAEAIRASKPHVSPDAMLRQCLTPAKAKAICNKIIDKAVDGDDNAYKWVFERTDGKAVQQVEQRSDTRLHVTFERLG